MKIFIVGNSINYMRWIDNAILTHNIDDADIALFTGGEDVTPSLYNELPHVNTYFNKERDAYEQDAYNTCLSRNIPCIGVCRGAQFLTVMQPGGKLIQDVKNHAIWGQHEITNLLQSVPNELLSDLTITSTHHQMMYPFDVDNHVIIAMANDRSLGYYMMNNIVNMQKILCEPEIVFYPNSKCLCIQGHPESMSKDHQTIKYLNYLVSTLLKK
jgi:putative glutamine amidotransferase